MQDLLAEAGLSAGAVYRYFDSKDAMIVAIAEENLAEVVSIVRDGVEQGDDVGTALASALEYVGVRHAEDGFGAIALLVWSEALRNPALAGRLADSFSAATAALAGVTNRALGDSAGLAPEDLANTLLCVLPGYLLQLTMRGAEAVKPIPDLLRALVARVGVS